MNTQWDYMAEFADYEHFRIFYREIDTHLDCFYNSDVRELWHVVLNGVAITNMLNEATLTELESECRVLLRKRQEDDATDYAADRANGYANVFFGALNRMVGAK